MPNPFSSLKNIVILTGLLLLILLAVVWFVGPYMGLARVDLRIFICLVLVLLWVIFLLLKKGKSPGSADANTQVNVTAPSLQAPTISPPAFQAPSLQVPTLQSPSMSMQAPSISSAQMQISSTGSTNMNQPVAPSSDQTVNFRAQLDRALQWLRRSKTTPPGSGDAAYRLPWYLVLGPPASGKSVLLSQSGLNFPYTDPDRSMGRRNVEPTRCCDLWMANESFFIDTAGRFCNSDQDRSLWQGLLEEIKRVRKDKPLDGVILVLDLPAIIQANPDALRELAVRARARLDEITQHLGMVLPVYLIFNKSDQVEGFVEFFSDLDDSLRTQVWGATLKREQYQNIQPHQEFEKEFGLLSQVIHIRRLSRLTTKAHEIKEKLYSFPVQYELIRNQLSEFITSLFQPNNFRERPIFRGFYFTSALQDSDTVDIVSNYINRKAGVTEARWTTPPAAEAKGFFFHRLLTQIIFPDRMLSGSSAGSKKRGLFLKILLILLFGVILPILMWLVYSSYGKYDRLLTTIQRAAQSPIVGNRTASELRVLRLLREELERYDVHYHPEAGNKFDWGINISRELIEPAQRLYEDRLKQDFINKTSHDLQVELANLPTTFPSVDEMRRNNQRCYLLLKTFLMMSTPKVGDEQYLSKSYSELGKFWQQGVAAEDLDEAQADMKFYMHLLAVHKDEDLLVPLDDNAHTLVTAKRGMLGGIDLLSNYYNRLKAGGAGQVPMTLGRALEGKDTDLMTGLVEIPGIFTRAGWESYSRKTIDDFGIEYDQGYWVLDRTAPNLDPNRPPRDAMTLKLSELYFTDYNNHWRNFIANARIAPFASRREAADKLGRLTRQDSPMLRFFKAVSVNTFEELEGKPSGNGYLDRLASNYHSIHQLVNGANAPISQYLQAVARVHQQLSAFVNAGEMPDQITPVKTAITDSLAQMAGLLQNFDPEMMRLAQPLMEQPIKMALEKTPMTETPTTVPAQTLAPLTPPTAQTSGVPGGMVVGGMITDRQKGTPLEKVVVYLLKPGNTEVTLNNYIALGTTDSAGGFRFPKAIAAGRYGLYVKAKGYKIIAQDITLSPGNALLKIGLDPQ
jgi:type VI secretion system IcmF/VasK family protein